MFEDLQHQSERKNVLQDTYVAGDVQQGDHFSFQQFDGTLNIDTLQFNNADGAENIKISLNEIRFKLADQYEQQIKLLQSQISDKEVLIGSLTENKNQAKQLHQLEIEKLKRELDQKITDAQQGKNQFNNFLSFLQKVDLNNASENYKTALDLFVEGKFEEAIGLLDDAKAAEDLKKVNELEEESNELEKKLKEAKIEAAEAKRKIAYEKSLKANLFGIKLDYEKAEYYHKEAISISPDYLTNHLYGVFLLSQGRLKESLVYLEKAVELSESDSAKAKNLALLGLTLIDMNQLKNAEENVIRAKEMLTILHTENKEPVTDTDIFIYIGLSLIASQKVEVNNAIEYGNTALELAEKLADETENKKALKSICLGNLGVFYAANNQLEDGIRFTKMYLEISEQRFREESKSPQNVVGIATSYNNLGRYNLFQKNLNDAEENYKKGLSICMDFVEKYPLIISKFVALLSFNLGQLYVESYMDKLPEAKSLFEKALDYRNKVSGDDNESIKFNSSSALLYLARIYLFEKDMAASEKYFRECVKVIDNLPEDRIINYSVFKRNVFYSYGNFLFENNQAGQAISYWQKSIEVYEKLFNDQAGAIVIMYVVAILYIGESYNTLAKDNAKAIELYQRAFEIDCTYRKVFPESEVNIVIKSYGQLYSFYNEASRSKEVEEIVNRMVEILDPFPELRKTYLPGLALAKRLIGYAYQVKEDHDYPKALEYYLQVYELAPDDYLNLLLMGDCYSYLTPPDFANAFKYYYEAFKIRDNDINLLRALTACTVNLPAIEFEKAEKIYSRHIELGQKDALPYIGMGDSYLLREPPDFANAFDYYYKAFEMMDNNINLLRALLNCIAKLPDTGFEKCEKIYTKYIELEPQNVWANLVMGDRCLDNKLPDYANAFKYYYQAFEIDGNNIDLLTALFNCVKNLPETPGDKLDKLYARYLQLRPAETFPYVFMGNFYENKIQPDFERALDYYKKACETDPTDKSVLREIGRFYQNIPKPDYNLSCKYLYEYVKQEPGDSQANFWLGWANFILGNYETAKTYFENSSSENGAEVYQNLGHIAIIQKDEIKAGECYKKSIELFQSKDKFYTTSIKDFEYIQPAGINEDYFISMLRKAIKD